LDLASQSRIIVSMNSASLETQKTHCPHCGEVIELVIDGYADQEYIEDCQVCCRPMMVSVFIGAESVDVMVSEET